MIDKDYSKLSVRQQAQILSVNRSTLYYHRQEPDEQKLPQKLVDLLKIIHEEHPYFGRRRLQIQLQKQGYELSCYEVRQLMKKLCIRVLFPARHLTKANKKHKKYPYLLKGLQIVRPNQVWATDITYVRLCGTYVFVMAIIDLYSRKILTWGVSESQTASFAVNILKEGIEVYGRPEIFNSDQGSQYTSNAFTALLSANEISISMDGVGRALDNVYMERFWRSLKYEDIYLRDYQSIGDLKRGLSRFISFYNSERPHQSLGYLSPDDLYVGVVRNKAKHLPHPSWETGYAPMEKMSFEECKQIFRSGVSKEMQLRAA